MRIVIALNTLTRRDFPPPTVRGLDAARVYGSQQPRHDFGDLLKNPLMRFFACAGARVKPISHIVIAS